MLHFCCVLVFTIIGAKLIVSWEPGFNHLFHGPTAMRQRGYGLNIKIGEKNSHIKHLEQVLNLDLW